MQHGSGALQRRESLLQALLRGAEALRCLGWPMMWLPMQWQLGLMGGLEAPEHPQRQGERVPRC